MLLFFEWQTSKYCSPILQQKLCQGNAECVIHQRSYISWSFLAKKTFYFLKQMRCPPPCSSFDKDFLFHFIFLRKTIFLNFNVQGHGRNLRNIFMMLKNVSIYRVLKQTKVRYLVVVNILGQLRGQKCTFLEH